MRRPLTVATECPTCGAPLSFQEGCSAVRCDYCRSNLLLTGRGRVLSYFVRPRIGVQEGAATAMRDAFGRGERLRLASAEFTFLPYYRVTGHDLRWEQGVREKPTRGPFDFYTAEGSGLASLGPRLATVGTDFLPPPSELVDRYVDKNFPALRADGLPYYSLGVRLAVLPLCLYNPASLGEIGRVVSPQVPVDEAEKQATETVAVRSRILARRLLERRLNVIYFPFVYALLERGAQRRIALVDGVTGKLVARSVTASLSELLHEARSEEGETVGFRPLVCPNCGWDLPLRPDDVAFHCRTCGRTYELIGRDLRPVRSLVLGDGDERVRYLPFWLLEEPAADDAPPRFFVPAFRVRRLRHLVDLARDVTVSAADCPRRDEAPPELLGCSYDREDARRLAEITWPRMASNLERAITRVAREELRYRRETLAWLPFRREHRTLRAPFCGRAIQERLLE